ncbi:MAG: hypothetical protein V1839_02695 [archaeon]
MKRKVLVLVLVFVVFVAVLFMLSKSSKPSESTNTTITMPETSLPETPIQCDDSNDCTTDSYNSDTKKCEYIVSKENCCGNGKCETSERCGETAHKTACPKDCPLECPALLIVHKTESGTTPDDYSYSCFGSICEELRANDFAFTGQNSTAGIKTFVANMGEIASRQITSNFYCEELEAPPNGWRQQATRYGESIRGIRITDYFDRDKGTIESLSGPQDGNSSTVYRLNFDTTNIELSTKIRCVIIMQSDNFRNQQSVLADFYKPK